VIVLVTEYRSAMLDDHLKANLNLESTPSSEEHISDPIMKPHQQFESGRESACSGTSRCTLRVQGLWWNWHCLEVAFGIWRQRSSLKLLCAHVALLWNDSVTTHHWKAAKGSHLWTLDPGGWASLSSFRSWTWQCLSNAGDVDH